MAPLRGSCRPAEVAPACSPPSGQDLPPTAAARVSFCFCCYCCCYCCCCCCCCFCCIGTPCFVACVVTSSPAPAWRRIGCGNAWGSILLLAVAACHSAPHIRKQLDPPGTESLPVLRVRSIAMLCVHPFPVRICRAGTGGAPDCPVCPRGTYADAGNRTLPSNPCTPCHAGQTTAAARSSLATQCDREPCLPCLHNAGWLAGSTPFAGNVVSIYTHAIALILPSPPNGVLRTQCPRCVGRLSVTR